MSNMTAFDLIARVNKLAGCNDCKLTAAINADGSAEASISFTYMGVTRYQVSHKENFNGAEQESLLYRTSFMSVERLIGRDKSDVQKD